MTAEQEQTVERKVRQFGAGASDFRIFHEPFDLPPGYVYVIAGEAKGRPFHFGVSPEGEVSS